MKKYLIVLILIFISYNVISGIVGYRLTRTSDFDIIGIDISHHNKIYNFKKIDKDKKFCIIKATEGKSFIDPKFKYNWIQSKKNKLIRGAYHYYSPKVSPHKQFDNFKKVVQLSKGDLPPFLDVEESHINVEDLNTWINLCKLHYGVEPIVYCNYFYFKKYLDKKLIKCPLWIRSPKIISLTPNFTDYKCLFWQYCWTGKVNGISGDVDLNSFLGSKTEFENILIK